MAADPTTRDGQTASDILAVAHTINHLAERLDRYESGARDEHAIGHANLYQHVAGKLRDGAEAILTASIIMEDGDPTNYGFDGGNA